MDDTFEDMFEQLRPELMTYLCRLVVRPHVAEDLVQTAFMRLIESGPGGPVGLNSIRFWLFRVATNLAVDERRRHSNWRESTILDLREAAEASRAFVAQSEALIGTPESKMVAREHLAACFACTLRNLPERNAAAFLLKEVHGFTLAEIGELLEATEGQSKNWLQEARAYMRARYDQTCALMTKEGVCYQCVELAAFFRSGEDNPIFGASDHLDARVNILNELRSQPPRKWHSLLLRLLDDLG
jgi:RNA polymerase sigma-70 factor, ECF subfamily